MKKSKMKIINLIQIILILNVFMIATVVADAKERQLHITSLTIQFDKSGAIFTVNYDFSEFAKVYLFMFGSKSLEPDIKSIFTNFDYEIIKMDQNKAILRVKNVSRLNKGYYLHDSTKFGGIIDTVYISDPNSKNIKEYVNLDSTPYYFYTS